VICLLRWGRAPLPPSGKKANDTSASPDVGRRSCRRSLRRRTRSLVNPTPPFRYVYDHVYGHVHDLFGGIKARISSLECGYQFTPPFCELRIVDPGARRARSTIDQFGKDPSRAIV